jgi:hypothetical protein
LFGIREQCHLQSEAVCPCTLARSLWDVGGGKALGKKAATRDVNDMTESAIVYARSDTSFCFFAAVACISYNLVVFDFNHIFFIKKFLDYKKILFLIIFSIWSVLRWVGTLFRSSLFFSLFFKRKGGCDRGAHFFSNPLSANCLFGHFGVTTQDDEQRQR